MEKIGLLYNMGFNNFIKYNCNGQVDMIPFNKPCFLGQELEYIHNAITNHKLSGDGYFNKRCVQLLQNKIGSKVAMLTPSGTAALEMAAMLIDIQAGDEVIMPSFTFVSTANAFVLRGATIVFVDIKFDTLNIDENLIENAITKKTKAIVVVHYGGVPVEMDKIMNIAKKYNLYVIEDAAHAIGSTYKSRYCGSLGHIGCFSFHETKNITCGEGGAITINDEKLIERAEIIREKGTNRSKFFSGQVDKYTWVDIGSSYLLSELCAAYLYIQLEHLEMINSDRLKTWNFYYQHLASLNNQGIKIMQVPQYCEHNAHLFYIITKDLDQRTSLIRYLKKYNIIATFHYVPLHSTVMGSKYSRFCGEDKYTSYLSDRLVRLPLYYGLEKLQCNLIIDTVLKFFNSY